MMTGCYQQDIVLKGWYFDGTWLFVVKDLSLKSWIPFWTHFESFRLLGMTFTLQNFWFTPKLIFISIINQIKNQNLKIIFLEKKMQLFKYFWDQQIVARTKSHILQITASIQRCRMIQNRILRCFIYQVRLRIQKI